MFTLRSKASLLGIFVLPFFLASCSSGTPVHSAGASSVVPLVEYKNDLYKFALHYPGNWTQEDVGKNGVFTMSFTSPDASVIQNGKSHPNAGFMILASKSSTPKADLFANFSMDSSVGGLPVTKKSEMKIQGETAAVHEGQGMRKNIEMKGIHILVVHNGFYYLFGYAAPVDKFEQLRPQFEAIRDSLKFQ